MILRKDGKIYIEVHSLGHIGQYLNEIENILKAPKITDLDKKVIKNNLNMIKRIIDESMMREERVKNG